MKKIFLFLMVLFLPFMLNVKAAEKATLEEIVDKINNSNFFQSEGETLEASYEGNTTNGKIKIHIKSDNFSDALKSMFAMFGLDDEFDSVESLDKTVEFPVTNGVIKCSYDYSELENVEEDNYEQLLNLMVDMVVDFAVPMQLFPDAVGQVYGYKDGAVVQMFQNEYLSEQLSEFTLEKDGFGIEEDDEKIIVSISTERPITFLTDLSYRTHVQNVGWQDYVHNGEMSGTSGQSLRLEGININLETVPYDGNVEYQTHIQNIGWEKEYKKNNEMSGTSGMSYRLEAIRIKLTGEIANHYDIYYRVHAENFGWLDWTKNGESAGTAGYAYRLEGIEIKLVEKGGKAPGATTNPFRQRFISYQTHVQNIGWQENKYDGEMSGTSGKSLRLEGIKINLENQKYSGNVEYKTHIQNIGWEKAFKKNGEMSGTSGMSYRLEAIQIKLTGEMAEHYDIYYRVHAENFGWLDWTKNGASAGTAGYAYRLEGIEIKLVEKGGTAPGKTTRPFVEK